MILEPEIVEKVKQALIQAAVNGYLLEGMSDAEVAGDLIAYDDGFADWSVEALTPYVIKVHNNLNGTMQ